MEESCSAQTTFDLQYVNKIADKYIIRKNDKIKNMYESNFEDVPLIETGKIQQEDDDEFKQEDDYCINVVKQYVSSMIYPNVKVKHDKTLPDITLELQFVNGYNPLQSIQNLFYASEQQIVFSSAILGVVMNIQTRKQRYYGVYGEQTSGTNFNKFHRAPIVSLDYQPTKKWVVTGSLGINPQICVWDPQNLTLISKFLQGKNSKSVAQVRFFMQGEYLITLQRSQKSNIIYLWSIKGQKKLDVEIEGSIYVITVWSNKFIVTSSKGCFQLIYNEQKNMIEKTKISDQFSVGAAYLDGQPIYANSYGVITYKQKQLKIDQECVFCITVYNDTIYTSGSFSKKLFVVNKQLEIVKSYQLPEYARAISVFGPNILVGLRNGIIAQIRNEEVQIIMQCHFVGELWGLTYNSQNNTFITAGQDNKIIHFDIKSNKVVKVEVVGQTQNQNKLYEKPQLNCFPSSKESRAIQVHQNKMVYTTNYAEIVLTYLDSKKRFTYQMEDISETLQFSDNGEQLAVGCFNDCILIFDISQQKGFELKSTLSGHQSWINDLDFSLDGEYLRSAGISGELRYWNLTTMKQIVLSSKNCIKQQKQIIKDNYWSGLCRFCWQTESLWREKKQDHEFFNRIALSKSEDYLAVGEDDNCLRIYRVPTDKFRKFRGHASHVINVCWSDNDEYLASIGGPDRCLMIWKVKEADDDK